MLLILPVLNFFALLLFAQRSFVGIRDRILVAGVWWTFELVIFTEALSPARLLTARWLAVLWLIATLGLVSALWLRKLPFRFQRIDSHLERGDRWMLAAVALICFLVAVTALVSAPNGSDQLQYHLPRMVQWADRHSVRFFPTHYYVQLFAPPLAEWAMLHTYLLTGGDRFVCLVQSLAFAGSAVAVSLIAKELGTSLKGQLLAAVLCVTLPQGILAASGAKNDWVLSLWLAAVVYFGFRFRWDRSWLNAVNAGLALGAALLSKGTVYAFLPAILFALLVFVLVSKGQLFLTRALVVATVALVMNGPQWARNYTLGGSIFGLPYPDVAGKEKYTVDYVSFAGSLSNALRELAMHLGSPSEKLNRLETGAVRAIISRMGVSPDDPALTNFSQFRIPHYDREEYYAGNAIHLLLTIIVFVVVLATWRRSGLGLTLLSLGIIAGFIFYCSLFKWEVWCARLHLPLFVLACAIVAAVIQDRFNKFAIPLAVLLLILAIPPTVCNETRPLLFSGRFGRLTRNESSILLRPRSELYFAEQGSLEYPYTLAAAAIRQEHCANIGMDTSVKIYAHEYPLFALGRNPGEESTFRYLDVHNLSSKYADDFDRIPPCVVVCPECRSHPEKWAEYQTKLPRVQSFGDLLVFARQVPGVSSQAPSQQHRSMLRNPGSPSPWPYVWNHGE